MPVNPDIIFILLYFQKKVYRQSEARRGITACLIYSVLFCFICSRIVGGTRWALCLFSDEMPRRNCFAFHTQPEQRSH